VIAERDPGAWPDLTINSGSPQREGLPEATDKKQETTLSQSLGVRLSQSLGVRLCSWFFIPDEKPKTKSDPPA